MARKPGLHAYLTINGQPFCRCEGHSAGLMNRLFITCGYPSINAARRAKTVVQRFRAGVKVERGECPAAR